MSKILHYQNYEASINFSLEDNVYYSKISNITDLVSFERDTIEELKIAFKEAVEEYLELCEEIGK